tara:strand:- start:439 stop:672 length:234 start_codon:yes stop_codon:yes gene_type:complete
MKDWNIYNTNNMPPENTRVLISDGNVTVIGHYALSENHINWFFNETELKDLDIQWWKYLPELPPALKRAEENTCTVD